MEVWKVKEESVPETLEELSKQDINHIHRKLYGWNFSEEPREFLIEEIKKHPVMINKSVKEFLIQYFGHRFERYTVSY